MRKWWGALLLALLLAAGLLPAVFFPSASYPLPEGRRLSGGGPPLAGEPLWVVDVPSTGQLTPILARIAASPGTLRVALLAGASSCESLQAHAALHVFPRRQGTQDAPARADGFPRYSWLGRHSWLDRHRKAEASQLETWEAERLDAAASLTHVLPFARERGCTHVVWLAHARHLPRRRVALDTQAALVLGSSASQGLAAHVDVLGFHVESCAYLTAVLVEMEPARNLRARLCALTHALPTALLTLP